MQGHFTDLEVREPQRMAAVAWDWLRPQERAAIGQAAFAGSREWGPLDRRRLRTEP